MQGAIPKLYDRCLAQSVGHFETDAPMPPAQAAFPVTVIIPIFNNLEVLRICVASVLKHTASSHTLLLLDDASTDADVETQLCEFSLKHASVQYKRRDKNLGYLLNVNQALLETLGDVVLLNSDTEVGPEWLDRLQRAAYSDANVAAVSPLSDNATLLSILPVQKTARFSTDQLQMELAECARAWFPKLPSIVGFCVYLKRVALCALGTFDPVFSPGYGEEDDFSQRARSKGWQLLAAPDVFVRHKGGASFGNSDKVIEVRQHHARMLAWRWPDFEREVRTWWRDWPLRELSERFRLKLFPRIPGRPRVLHVLHRFNRVGGTETQVRELLACWADKAQHTLLAMEHSAGQWADVVENEDANGVRIVCINQLNVQPNQRIAGWAADLSDAAQERNFARWIASGDYDLLHVHHLIGWNTLLIPSIATALGLPVVLSLHCHFSMCPDSAMVQHHGKSVRHCELAVAGAAPSCARCLSQRREIKLGLDEHTLGSYFPARHYFWQRLFADCFAVIVPSNYLAQRVLNAYPDLITKLSAIEHGTTQVEPSAAIKKPANATLNIGFLGGDGDFKGFRFLQSLAERCLDLPVQFDAYGVNLDASHTISQNLILHGPFQAENRTQIIQRFDLILLPALLAETFSMVLSESNALGVPVLASALGALRERIKAGLHGWCLDIEKPELWFEKVKYFLTDSGRSELKNAGLALIETPFKTIESQAQEYWSVYDRAIQSNPVKVSLKFANDIASARVALARPKPELMPEEIARPRRDRQRMQFAAIARDDWAASQYRVHEPLALLERLNLSETPIIWRAKSQNLPSANELINLEVDTLLLLNAIDPDSLALLAALSEKKSKIRRVLVLDDHLPARQATSDIRLVHRLREVCALCDCLITTTPALAEQAASWVRLETRVHIIPNVLCLPIWQPILTQCVSKRGRREIHSQSKLRVLYAGAAQHESDLDILLPVVSQTYERYQWVFFGLQPNGINPGWKVEFHSAVQYADYPRAMANLNPDICVAPLQNNAFNCCKSNLKALEYGALNVPMIASRVVPYLDCPAILVESTAQWCKALQALECADLRQVKAEELSNWAFAQSLEAKSAGLWVTALQR